jgi:hypothetical protein
MGSGKGLVQLLALLVLYGAITAFSQTPLQEELIRGIDQADHDRETNLAGYTVTEFYTIKNSHFGESAKATVEATYLRGEGKTYKVVSRSGPSFLQGRIMDRLLQEEAVMSRGKGREEALVTSANYEMKLKGEETIDGAPCQVLELTPRRKSPHLLKGRLWIDATSKTSVKIEGKPPASPSFFAGRPMVVREYKQIAGFTLAQHSRAVTSGLFLGQTEVDIEYRDYHIKEK